MKSLFLNVLWLKLYFVWGAVLLRSESSQYHKLDWNNWNLNRHFILLGLYPPPCLSQQHTHTHIMALIDILTFSTVKYSWFLEGANAGIHQLQTSGQLVLNILLSIRCEGEKRMRVSKTGKECMLVVFTLCRLTLTVKVKQWPWSGTTLTLWYVFESVIMSLCVWVCVHLCVFAIIF